VSDSLPTDDEDDGNYLDRIEEASIHKMLLALLPSAKRGLRRKSIDEIESLFTWLKYLPESEWPPSVALFVRRFKRPRGRMRSQEATDRRRWQNPVRVAALLAQSASATLRAENSRQYKLILSDGSKINVRTWAIRWAVDYVNRSLRKGTSDGCRQVDESAVETLLRKGRIRPPVRRFDYG
jgi:hypothetical protein